MSKKYSKQFYIYTGLVVLLVIIALIGPWITPQDPYESRLANAFKAPSAEHWFGTDKLGRDLFSRMLAGLQISLFASLAVVILMGILGLAIGIVAGYKRGIVDIVLMRIADIMLSFPGIILAIAISGILGGSIINAILALVIVGWAKYARMVRSVVLQIRNEDYVGAARTYGTSTWGILYRHMLPNVLPMIIVFAAVDLGTMIIEVAGLSFIGFGAQPPTPEWGLMLNEGRQYLQNAPWLMFFPGVGICIVVAICNVWADALRDVLDPREEA